MEKCLCWECEAATKEGYVSVPTATAKTGFTCISAMMVTVSVRVMCGLIHDAIIFVGVP